MKKIISLLFPLTVCFWSCLTSTSKTKDNLVTETVKTQNKTNSVNPAQDILMNISLKEAIKKYGEPKISDSFNTKEGGISEFRIELLNYLSQEEIKKGVLINELTWEADSLNNITVWYTKRGKHFMPIHSLIWDKQSEF